MGQEGEKAGGIVDPLSAYWSGPQTTRGFGPRSPAGPKTRRGLISKKAAAVWSRLLVPGVVLEILSKGLSNLRKDELRAGQGFS